MLDTPSPRPPQDAAPVPVFLDATGRRLKRARVAGGAVTALVVAYVALLLSAALGGPSIDAPFLPRPAAPTKGLAAIPRASLAVTAMGASTGGASTSAGANASGATSATGAAGAGNGAAPGATSVPSGVGATAGTTAATGPVVSTGTPAPPTTTAVPTATATSRPGRSASAPGRTAHPTPSSTSSPTVSRTR